MTFSPEVADIRFGCGLSPLIAPTRSAEALLEGLHGQDTMRSAFPIETFDVFLQRTAAFQRFSLQIRKEKNTAKAEALFKKRQKLNRDARNAMTRWFSQTVLRWTYTEHGFRERLAFFWADHFTAHGRSGVLRRATSPFVEDAIRPNIATTFADLLIAAVTHPLMLHYLNQNRSVGPNSPVISKNRGLKGLNENLAREVLELHTLGVDGPYSQNDVRQLAELFTGMTFRPDAGFRFNKSFVEPGAETVLNKTYESVTPSIKPIHAVLRDLAAHPATARHIAWKLAVHFVSDTPDAGLIDHLTARYLETGGALAPLYAALLEHPAAWDDRLQNVKPPADYVASACRTLQVSSEGLRALKPKQQRRHLLQPLTLMGQIWQTPPGPDGWPEEDAAWLTPQGVAARMHWAMTAPRTLLNQSLPDPRQFVTDALGSRARDAVRFAARAAESRPEAIGLVLASPAFQRR